MGNIGEGFEEDSAVTVSTWTGSWRVSIRGHGRNLSLESDVPGGLEAGTGGGTAIEMIEVSELMMERERAIGWDQIWAAGING